MASTIQQLFLGTAGTFGSGGGLGGGIPGLGTSGAFPGTSSLLGGAGGLRPLVPLTLGGVTPEGAPLIDLRLTVDRAPTASSWPAAATTWT